MSAQRSRALDDFEWADEKLDTRLSAPEKRKRRKPSAPSIRMLAPDKPIEKESVKTKSGSRLRPFLFGFAIASFVFILLIGGFIALCTLGRYDESGKFKYLIDPDGSIRGPLLMNLTKDRSFEEYYVKGVGEGLGKVADLEDELNEGLNDLKETEKELEEWEADLEQREDDLYELEEELSYREQNLPAVVTSPIDALGELSSTLAKMDPAKAAAAIIEMTDKDMAIAALRTMSFAKRAKILDAMAAADSAEIFEMLGDQPEVE